ncbi:uncharacterized protein LOC131437763 isoform X2 [Malaya genurostris]|uniref:uncharacterized protein LOC131437763 isoform X2 n=1 Tax=Malaya genurostris TaxID=325434 RepID=UPI0026F3D8B3|nr:uncharacterized protein LOC131437763 isoform X2 [Malaya genurostris]
MAMVWIGAEFCNSKQYYEQFSVLYVIPAIARESCSKIWIGLMAFSANKGIDVDFWNCLQKALEKIEIEVQDTGKRSMRAVLAGANDCLFQTWLMNGIISLYQFKIMDPNSLMESPVITLDADLMLLNRASKNAVSGEKSEEQMRIFLLLLKPIYTEWLSIRHDYLVLLWEYFSKRLSSPFQLASESLSNLACVNRTLNGFMEQARNRAGVESFKKLNVKDSSFKCYLSLIGYVLRQYSDTGQKTKVLILFNRTILKITPQKLETMNEQSIYNFSLLMFTMIEATSFQDDYSRLSKQLLHFKLDQLTPTSTVESSVQRITIITLVNMALILIFNERDYDKTNHLHQFLDSLEKARQKFGERLQPTLQVLAEGMCAALGRAISKRCFEEADSAFFGDWLEKYLKGCSECEREGVLETICGIFDCLRQNSKNSMIILQPLYTIVLPFIKDIFSNDTGNSRFVAELSAHFTNYSTGQPYAPPFLALFSFFTDNPTANIHLRLQYIKLMVNSDRLNEIDEKLIIRSWLKFALLYSHEQLGDLSRVVCRMREFNALCEIPEYDLCNGDEEPIGLFFKSVGKKYKQYEGKDSRAQYELTIKVHALFQHFDKWILNPGVVVLRRIMTILALALKECGAVIYIKSNSTCLYHVAFNQYFLPISVLTDRNVPNDAILSMGKVWSRIMDAMGLMNYTTDPVISDHVTNMMVKWAPQFLKFKDKNDAARPFVNFFSSQNESLVTFAFNRYLYAYVELQGTTPKAGSEHGMKILLYLLDTLCSSQDNSKIALFIRLAASSILDHAMLANEAFPSKTVANELVQKLLQCTRNNSNLIKMELKLCLSTFTKKNLSMESAIYFRFLYKLADREPEFIKSTISTIQMELTETERLRGGGEDKHLRRLLMQLEGAVEASLKKHVN